METSTELVPVDTSPAELVGMASKAAAATKAIVEQTAQVIQGRRYVRVEGWQAIALAHGCVASSGQVERTETGFRAVGEIRRRDNGALVATAEGFVGDDEPTWSKRPEFARRAMAQTRAISRACRSAFAHVVVMMQANLETTPAEEMEHLNGDSKPSRPTRPAKSSGAADARRGEPPAPAPTSPAEVVEGVLEKCKPKGKATWAMMGGEWYSTFSATDAALLNEAADAGLPVRLHWHFSPDGKWRNIDHAGVTVMYPLADSDAVEPEYEEA